jgi:hypothetical protein
MTRSPRCQRIRIRRRGNHDLRSSDIRLFSTASLNILSSNFAEFAIVASDTPLRRRFVMKLPSQSLLENADTFIPFSSVSAAQNG